MRHVPPHRIKEDRGFYGAVLSMLGGCWAEQVLLPAGEARRYLVQTHGAQHAERSKGRGECSMFKFVLSCREIRVLFPSMYLLSLGPTV